MARRLKSLRFQKIWFFTSSGGLLESRAHALSSPTGGWDSW
jgi:hypothetical protein